jgi:ComF family protein
LKLFSRLFSPDPAGPDASIALDTQDCFFCGAPSHAPLCGGCGAALPRLPAARCPSCALPALDGRICGRCLGAAPHYDATAAALAYAYPVDGAIQAFKYRRALGLTRSFADLIEAALDGSPAVGLVIPAPLSARRLAERGYNQANELARVLARRRRLALDPTALARVKQGPHQAELPWKERAKNIRGAFVATRRFDGLAIAVVDDVMTTGSTLNEIAKTLKAAGAARVTNWVLARTLPAVMQPPKD